MGSTRFLELFSLFAFAFIPGVFVLEFDANLHCSQWTSFRIAVFDPVPHEEELPAPLVYQPPYPDALRSVLAVVLLVFLFAPFACLCCVARRWWKATSARWALCSAFTLLVVARLIPERIIGERFSALYSAAAVLGLMLYGASFWLLVRHQRSGEFLATPR